MVFVVEQQYNDFMKIIFIHNSIKNLYKIRNFWQTLYDVVKSLNVYLASAVLALVAISKTIISFDSLVGICAGVAWPQDTAAFSYICTISHKEPTKKCRVTRENMKYTYTYL